MDTRQPPLPFFLSQRCPDLSDEAVSAGILKAIEPLAKLADFATPGNTSRPLKADGQAGTLARYLLSAPGNSLTVQRAVEWLANFKMVSNCPDRRLREARRWLEREGLTIKEVELENCTEWSVVWDSELIQQARQKLTLKQQGK